MLVSSNTHSYSHKNAPNFNAIQLALGTNQ